MTAFCNARTEKIATASRLVKCVTGSSGRLDQSAPPLRLTLYTPDVIVAVMDVDELRRTAELAQLSLDDQEFADLSGAAEEVLEFFAVLQETPVSADETSDDISLSSLRADAVSHEISPDALLEAAPEVEDRLILIPNVL